jgi:hypothetical protein
MNRYGQMLLDFNRRHRPQAFAQIEDPERFFDQAGDQIEADIAQVRDQILGAPRPGENPEQYRLRSYQALDTARELVTADHWLLIPEATDGEAPDLSDDPELAAYYQDLDLINDTIIQIYDR